MIEKIQLNALKYFYYVANFGSVTAASQKLYVTQGAVSKQVKNLEEILDVPLFDRVNKRLVLTIKGQALYDTCQKVFSELDTCLIELNEKSDVKNKPLIFSCESTLSMRWLIPRLNEFKSLNHGFDVILLTACGAIDFKKSGVDIALRRNNFDWGRHVYSEKMVDEYILAVKNHNYKDKKNILLSSSRPLLWDKLRAAGLLAKEILKYERSELEHFYLCIEGCLSGLGATMASIYMLEKELSCNLVSEIGLPMADGSSYHLLSSEPFLEDERKIIFKEWLQTEMRTTRDSFISQ